MVFFNVVDETVGPALPDAALMLLRFSQETAEVAGPFALASVFDTASPLGFPPPVCKFCNSSMRMQYFFPSGPTSVMRLESVGATAGFDRTAPVEEDFCKVVPAPDDEIAKRGVSCCTPDGNGLTIAGADPATDGVGGLMVETTSDAACSGGPAVSAFVGARGGHDMAADRLIGVGETPATDNPTERGIRDGRLEGI